MYNNNEIFHVSCATSNDNIVIMQFKSFLCPSHHGIYIDNSLHLTRKYAWIFGQGHYLFFEKWTGVWEHSSRKNVSFKEQIMPEIKWKLLCLLSFEYFLQHMCIVLKIGEYHSDMLQVLLWNIHNIDIVRPIACERKYRYLMDHNSPYTVLYKYK